MWPWAHVALGYLCYSLYLRVQSGGLPAGWPVLALVAGTQFPDVVDKPLTVLGVLPHGRTLAHSALVVALVSVAVLRYGRRRDRPALGVGFVVGYWSHLLGDVLHSLLTGQWLDLTFLVWPLLPVPSPGLNPDGLFARLTVLRAEPFALLGLLLTAAVFGLWHSHDRPGLAELRSLARPD